jgi:Family of unknown function (DUF6111)
MLRVVLINIVLFALPFLLYAAYMMLAKKVAAANVWQGAPVAWLAGAGPGLLLIATALLISFSGGAPGGIYHPPRIEDGVIKPGTID